MLTGIIELERGFTGWSRYTPVSRPVMPPDFRRWVAGSLDGRGTEAGPGRPRRIAREQLSTYGFLSEPGARNEHVPGAGTK